MKNFLFLTVIIGVVISCASPPPHKTSYYEKFEESYQENRFEMIDRETLKIKKRDEESIDSLIRTIESYTRTDWEKARAIYIWLTFNVEYDVKGYLKGDKMSCKPEDVLDNRCSVCAGYANLFTELGTGLGLDVRTVSGYAKGASFQSGNRPSGTNHAWNVVYIDGEAHLFDSTWGAGSLWGNRFKRDYKEFYFDADPEKLIFTHFPKNNSDQLLISPLDRNDFFDLPNIHSSMFDNGFDGGEYLRGVKEGKVYSTPTIYTCGYPFEVFDFPVTSTLKAGETYHFHFRSKQSSKMSSLNNGERRYYFSHDGGYYEFEDSFDKGTVTFYLWQSSGGKGIVRYEVE